MPAGQWVAFENDHPHNCHAQPGPRTVICNRQKIYENSNTNNSQGFIPGIFESDEQSADYLTRNYSKIPMPEAPGFDDFMLPSDQKQNEYVSPKLPLTPQVGQTTTKRPPTNDQTRNIATHQSYNEYSTGLKLNDEALVRNDQSPNFDIDRQEYLPSQKEKSKNDSKYRWLIMCVSFLIGFLLGSRRFG